MKTFAIKEKQLAPAARKARPYVHHPMGPVQQAQQAEIRHILRSTGAQAKRTVGQPHDKYEQEADRVADQVMRMPEPPIQRQVEPEEKEEEAIETPIQPTGDRAQTPQISPSLAASMNALKGGGSPLPQVTRAYFEPRFGADFSQVRVHLDARAAKTAKSIHAKAFTVRRDVAFGTGQYAPHSYEGRQLLAHELAHVVQQKGGNRDSFVSRQVQPTRQQQADARRVRRKLSRAITLLQNARQYLATAGQGELLDEMLNTFNQITTRHFGLIDINRRRIRLGRPIRLSYTFTTRGQVSRPFEYRIYFDLSFESGGSADAYFRGPSNYAGFIVVKVPAARTASIDGLAKLLVHEALHMYSHLQRAVQARIGPRAVAMVPTRDAAAIINTSTLSPHRRAFHRHFNTVRVFLNRQSHRRLSTHKFPASVVHDWTRNVIEETIAYVYQSRVDMAFSRLRTAGTRGPTVNMALGFVPLQFLRNYLTRHWLTESDDQAAMATQQGQALLASMSSDMRALHGAVENQVGPL